MTFLYCNHKESRSPSTYLRLALKQLCRRMPHLPPALEKLYELHHKNNSQPKYIELEGVFSTIAKQFDCVFLTLDALDECSPHQRKALGKFVSGITKPKPISTAARDNDNPTGKPRGIVKVFVTSRTKPDLEQAFQQNSAPTIEMEATKVSRDIEDYVKGEIKQRLQDGSLVLKNQALEEKILTTLTTKAGGMYVPSCI